MQVTIDSSDPLDKALRVVSSLYGVSYLYGASKLFATVTVYSVFAPC